MYEKYHNNFNSPDISKLQEVIIDEKTKIYISVESDPVKAKNRFLERQNIKMKGYGPPKKT